MAFFKNTNGTTEDSYTIGNVTLIDVGNSLKIINSSSSLHIPVQGVSQFIYVPYSYQNSVVKSSSSVPVNAWILNTINKVEEPFNGSGANLEIIVSGSGVNTTLMNTGVSNLLTNNQFVVEDIFKITDSGPVTINIYSSGSTNGSGSVLMSYVIPNM